MTQRAYLLAVCKLAGHYGKSPAEVSEQELRAYFLHLAQRERCARARSRLPLRASASCSRPPCKKAWPVLGLVRAGKEKKLPVVLSQAEVRTVLGSVRAPVYRACLSTIYACGLRISEGVAVQVGDVDGQRKMLRVRGKSLTTKALLLERLRKSSSACIRCFSRLSWSWRKPKGHPRPLRSYASCFIRGGYAARLTQRYWN